MKQCETPRLRAVEVSSVAGEVVFANGAANVGPAGRAPVIDEASFDQEPFELGQSPDVVEYGEPGEVGQRRGACYGFLERAEGRL